MTCLLSLLVLLAFKYNAKSISHILTPEYAGNPLQSISNEFCPAPQILSYPCLAAAAALPKSLIFFLQHPCRYNKMCRYINFLMNLLEYVLF